MSAPEAVLAAARRWLDEDPDPETRAELAALLDAQATDASAAADLADRFAGRLAFGTAGLRGALGAGPRRMNRVVVLQTAAGFAAFLRARAAEGTEGTRPRVVIGYDGRRNSDVFARDSAAVFAAAGLEAILLPRPLPTPVLAFAVRHLGADAGVMVTASHNPPDDNGYKVYLGGEDAGSQIVPPADGEIAAAIERVAARPVSEIERADDARVDASVAGDDVEAAYVAATAAVASAPAGAAGTRWVYTAMHGVGWRTFAAVLEASGFDLPVTVDAQIHPDGRFPTVSFPNPEEPGAMDLAFTAAREADAAFVVAHDPDADRLAVAIPDASAEGGWRRLTGNQIGLLLGWRAARAHEGEEGASLASSLVSSPGLAAVAERYGLVSHATLTGFKWISRAPGLVFGYEEALGYLVNPDTVRDKDGISASIAMLELAAAARAEGRTIADLLAAFDAEFGAYASDQVSVRVDDLAVIAATMAALRADPPAAIGGLAVEAAEDLAEPGGELPPGDILRYALEGGSRVIVRPSGTEPKLKFYLDVRGTDASDAERILTRVADGVRALLKALSS